jgi:cytochrome c biogenesis protein CcmG/thiol:disulfide interchange protein DsbE
LDRVMSQLARQPLSSAEETLDRLINEVLVLEAAGLQNAEADPAAIEKRIAALEAAWGIGDEQVVAALKEAGLSRETLVRRAGRLLLVEQGLTIIAAQRGDADAWLNQARRQAHVTLHMPLAATPPVPEAQRRVVAARPEVPGTSFASTPTVAATLATGPEPGALAPEFVLPDLQGRPVSLSSLRGRPVLISFWATWCPICRSQMPTLQAAYERYRESGLAILGVAVREDQKTVAGFAQGSGLAFPLLPDSEGAVAAIYRVRGIPTSLFVGPDGLVAARHVGPLTPEALEGYLATLPPVPLYPKRSGE